MHKFKIIIGAKFIYETINPVFLYFSNIFKQIEPLNILFGIITWLLWVIGFAFCSYQIVVGWQDGLVIATFSPYLLFLTIIGGLLILKWGKDREEVKIFEEEE